MFLITLIYSITDNNNDNKDNNNNNKDNNNTFEDSFNRR